MKATRTMAMTQEGHPRATVELTTAQRRHLTRLIRAAEVAEMGIKEAERLRDATIANANGYVAYLAEEHGVSLGNGEWAFDQDDYRFVQQEAAIAAYAATVPAIGAGQTEAAVPRGAALTNAAKGAAVTNGHD